MEFHGVMPAITTPFLESGEIDHAFLAEHARWMIDEGCTAIVPLGSLGEGATLDLDEKRAVLATLIAALGDRAPVMPGIAALSTHQAVGLARLAADLGCGGLMVLPPYLHKGEMRETIAHLDQVLAATSLPCMLYNNPVAYGVDLRPEIVAELALRHENLVAVKESSGDVRRVTALEALVGGRLALFVGLDDCLVEGVRAGAVGWIAGLVNALPAESVRLFDLALTGEDPVGLAALYRWFLPLLRLDTVPEFVQLIKLVQEETGRGSERVRPPRLPLVGAAREAALATIREALAERPGGAGDEE
ncbi:MAG: dihydrodipicolinate synthase family protein [Planctomycetota bacterium]